MESEVANDEGSSELDIYLMEKPVPRTSDRMGREFDVLGWWGRNATKYPVIRYGEGCSRYPGLFGCFRVGI